MPVKCSVLDQYTYCTFKETNITLKKNIIQQVQIGTLKILHDKDIVVFNDFAHPDDPLVAKSHSLILVKKIVSMFASMRLKHHCKIVRQTVLDQQVRKKLSKLILFKGQ